MKKGMLVMFLVFGVFMVFLVLGVDGKLYKESSSQMIVDQPISKEGIPNLDATFEEVKSNPSILSDDQLFNQADFGSGQTQRKGASDKIIEKEGANFNFDENSNLEGVKYDSSSMEFTSSNGNMEIAMNGDYQGSTAHTTSEGGFGVEAQSGARVNAEAGKFGPPGSCQACAGGAGAPQAASGDFFGGSGGGGGLASAGGSPTAQLDQAVQVAMQLAGQVASLFQKPEDEVPPTEGDTFPDASPGLAQLAAVSEDTDADVDGNGKITVNDGLIATADGGSQTFLAGQNDQNSPAIIEPAGGNNVELTNVDFVRPNEVAGKTSTTTTLELNGISGSDSSFGSQTVTGVNVFFLPIIKRSSLVLIPQISNSVIKSVLTGNVVGNVGQSIRLNQHDLEVNGHDIDLYALKTFNRVQGGGSDLNFYNGNIQVRFNGQRIMYSRTVRDAPYGVRELSNKLDPNHRYNLQHYTDRLSKLEDSEGITTVSDLKTTISKGPYQRLTISKKRANMFK